MAWKLWKFCGKFCGKGLSDEPRRVRTPPVNESLTSSGQPQDTFPYRLIKPYPLFTLNHLTVPVTLVAANRNTHIIEQSSPYSASLIPAFFQNPRRPDRHGFPACSDPHARPRLEKSNIFAFESHQPKTFFSFAAGFSSTTASESDMASGWYKDGKMPGSLLPSLAASFCSELHKMERTHARSRLKGRTFLSAQNTQMRHDKPFNKLFEFDV